MAFPPRRSASAVRGASEDGAAQLDRMSHLSGQQTPSLTTQTRSKTMPKHPTPGGATALAFRSKMRLAAVPLLMSSALLLVGHGRRAYGLQLSEVVDASGCQSVTVLVTEITPELNGTRINVSVDAPATMRTFEGTGTTQILPPATWNPLTATPDELRYYGLPQVASDPTDAEAWTDEWANYTAVPITPCISLSSNPPASTYEGNFAGVTADGTPITPTPMER